MADKYRMRYQVLLWAIVASATGGCSSRNPAYCETTADCEAGHVCDVTSHSCDTNSIDAMPAMDSPPPECDLKKPFVLGTEITELREPTSNEAHPSLTSDELTIYFASTRFDPNGNPHIFRASRTSRDSTFGAVTRLESLVGQHELNPSVSADGNTLVFARNYVPDNQGLFVSTRANTGATFPAPTKIPDTAFVDDPYLTADGNALYAANLSTGAIVRLPRVGATFSAPQGVETNIPNQLTSPASSDDLTLFLSSRQEGIFMVQRSTKTAGWGTPSLLAEFGPWSEMLKLGWISNDGCRMYYSAYSNLKTRIFVAHRPK